LVRRLGLFLSVILLLGLTLGCGLSGLGGIGGEEAPSPTEAPPGGEVSEPPSGGEVSEPPGGGAETEEEEEIGLSSVSSGLQSLDSYRSSFKMAFEGTTGGEAEQWAYEMDVETVRDPFAQRVVIRGSDVEEAVESVQIGDRQYLVLGQGQCISSSADESDTMDTEIFEPDDVIGGLAEARRVRPDEKVNGVLCRHYTFDESNVGWGTFAHAEGEVWVAVEGDYVVRYTLQADGKTPVTGDEEGHIEWEYEVRDVNAPITIEPPAGCESAESDFPIMPDATDMTTMGGMVMYTSASSFDDVLAFYQEQMPANGWSDTGDPFISSDNAMLGYSKEGRSVTITLAREDGTVSVLIMSE
jgi:hypothetical protein